jgi:hypothetical protein
VCGDKCEDESCFQWYLTKKQCRNCKRVRTGPDQARPVPDRVRPDWWNHWSTFQLSLAFTACLYSPPVSFPHRSPFASFLCSARSLHPGVVSATLLGVKYCSSSLDKSSAGLLLRCIMRCIMCNGSRVKSTLCAIAVAHTAV